MSSNTTLLGLNLPQTGGDSGIWGDDINNGMTELVEISLAGTNNITVTTDVTLSITNGNNSSSFSSTATNSTVAQYAVINLTGSRSTTQNIIVPAYSKTYIVYNNTSGGQSVTVKKSGGTGVSVANGEKAICYYDNVTATDVIKIASSVVTASGISGVVSATNGGTGVANNSASTITISGNFGTTLTVTGTTAVTLPTSGTLLSTAALVTTAQGGTGSSTLTFPSGTVSIGYLNIPQNSQSAAYTTVAADAGTTIFHPASDANARTFTIAANASVPYAIGTVIQFINMSSSNVTIAINSDTLTWASGGTSGSRTLAQYGVANCIKIATTQWLLTGANVT